MDLGKTLQSTFETVRKNQFEDLNQMMSARPDANIAELMGFIINQAFGVIASRVDETLAENQQIPKRVEASQAKFQAEIAQLVLGAVKSFYQEAAEVRRMHQDVVAGVNILRRQMVEIQSGRPITMKEETPKVEAIPAPAPVPQDIPLTPREQPKEQEAPRSRDLDYPLDKKRSKFVRSFHALRRAGEPLKQSLDLRRTNIKVPGYLTPKSMCSLAWNQDYFRGMSWQDIIDYCERNEIQAEKMRPPEKLNNKKRPSA